MTPVYDAALLLSERPAAHFWVMCFFFAVHDVDFRAWYWREGILKG